MSALSTAHSVVAPSGRVKLLAGSSSSSTRWSLVPLLWIGLTSIKTPPDSISYPPKVVPSCISTLDRRLLQPVHHALAPDGRLSRPLPPPSAPARKSRARAAWWSSGPSNYVPRFVNSLIIAFGSTCSRRASARCAAYAFSRFKVPLKDDLLFFILSTRMMPPIAVAIPIFLMYRELGLSDTRLGMILLYTSVNVSLAVWLLKGFIDEIPREYEEAAMIDGYTRLQAFRKVVLPQATTGIVATAIFCLIFAWNEYAFAVLLTSGTAQTAPPFIPIIIGEGGQDWPAVAAGTTLFLIPILVFTVLLRKHLLRGITFGAVRK